MKYRHRSVLLNKSYIFKFHPLTGQLFEIINQSYLNGGQNEYLAEMRKHVKLNTLMKSKIVYVLKDSQDDKCYQVIGGCFHPFFRLDNDIIREGSTIMSCFTLGTTIELRPKEKIEFEQDVIDFIYADFISSISLISLKKFGFVVKYFNEVSKKYKSEIWDEIFINDKDYLTQKEFCKILDVSTNTIHKHTQGAVKLKDDLNRQT